MCSRKPVPISFQIKKLPHYPCISAVPSAVLQRRLIFKSCGTVLWKDPRQIDVFRSFFRPSRTSPVKSRPSYPASPGIQNLSYPLTQKTKPSLCGIPTFRINFDFSIAHPRERNNLSKHAFYVHYGRTWLQEGTGAIVDSYSHSHWQRCFDFPCFCR